jgi:hypothetical protein
MPIRWRRSAQSLGVYHAAVVSDYEDIPAPLLAILDNLAPTSRGPTRAFLKQMEVQDFSIAQPAIGSSLLLIQRDSEAAALRRFSDKLWVRGTTWGDRVLREIA